MDCGMKTANVQDLRAVSREILTCPVSEIALAETGPGQPVVLGCNHYISTKGLEQLLKGEGDLRRCPECQQPIPEGAKLAEFIIAPQIVHNARYPAKGFPADGPIPARRGNMKITPHQALQSVDHSGLLNPYGEIKPMQTPIQHKRVIDDRPGAALVANARYVRSSAIERTLRRQLQEQAQSDPNSVPYQVLRVGDIVVSKSPRELKQEASKGLERFLMDSIHSLGDVSVSMSSLVPGAAACTAGARGTTAGGGAEVAVNAGGPPSAEGPRAGFTAEERAQALSTLSWDVSEDVSLHKLLSQSEEACDSLCRQAGRTREQIQIDLLEAALERSLEIKTGEQGLVKALDRVRQDCRNSRLFVVTGVDEKTHKAEVRRVHLGNLRRLQPLRHAWHMQKLLGGAMKGPKKAVSLEQEGKGLGAQNTGMQGLGELLFGGDRDETWVESLLSEDDDAAARQDDAGFVGQEDCDDESLGWSIYDSEDGEEEDSE